jgi:hypothetical protein
MVSPNRAYLEIDMFGRVSKGSNNTTYAVFNSKTGLFTINHNQQNAENSFREHTATTGRVSYKEEHEALMDVMVRRVLIAEEPNFDDKSKMDKKIKVSVRSQDGNDALITFPMGQFAVKVLGLLRAADLTKPISLIGGAFEKGTKKTNLGTGEETIRDKAESFLYGVQDGVKLKASFSDDPAFRIPKVEKVEVKNAAGKVLSTVNDPTNRDTFTLALAEEVKAKVEAAAKGQPNIAPAAAKPAVPDASAEDHGLSSNDVLGDGGAADEAAFADAPSA